MGNKDLVTKGILGFSVASIIAASCSSDDLWIETDENTEYLKQFSDEGNAALSINLSHDEIEYLNFLDKLGKDVVNTPAIARQFSKDPATFIHQYGYNGKIDFDEGMLKLMLALGDEDINDAINQNDISKSK